MKVTFTLDEETVARLRRIAIRLAKAQSHVVREAIREYDARGGKLTDEERRRLLAEFDRLVPALRSGGPSNSGEEIREVRAARRASSVRRSRVGGS